MFATYTIDVDIQFSIALLVDKMKHYNIATLIVAHSATIP